MTEPHACDTSLLVPALLSWHAEHESSRRALRDTVTHVPAHVLLETYSVLTRLPAPHRITPDRAGAVVQALKLPVCSLPDAAYAALIPGLAVAGVRGGAVYDALIGATAAHHGLRLLTRDRRARATYELLGVRYSVL